MKNPALAGFFLPAIQGKHGALEAKQAAGLILSEFQGNRGAWLPLW
jgi:hypothetical protein